jgi:hypothetical protein
MDIKFGSEKDVGCNLCLWSSGSGDAVGFELLGLGFVLWVAGGALDVGVDVAAQNAEVDLVGVQALDQVLVQLVGQHPHKVFVVDDEVVWQRQFFVVVVQSAAEALVVRLVRVPAADRVLRHQVVHQDAVLGHGRGGRLRQLAATALGKNLAK